MKTLTNPITALVLVFGLAVSSAGCASEETPEPSASEESAIDPGAGRRAVDRKAIVAYATKYALRYNGGYRKFNDRGGDCTNFISQALDAGRWTHRGSIFNRGADDAWFYNGIGQSYSWVSAPKWNAFARDRRRATVTSDLRALQLGDIVQIDFDGDRSVDHSMIVTGKDAREIYVSYHTTDTLNRPLSQLQRGYPKAKFYGWRLTDPFVP